MYACAADCTKALTLLTPPVPDNASSRLKTLARRATALAALEDYQSALEDLEQALRIDPDNEALIKDRNRVLGQVASSGAS